MALFRALESARPENRRLFHDPFAATFLRAPLRSVVLCSAAPFAGALLRRVVDFLGPGARTSAVARTRLIDDWVCVAIEGGSQQLVVLGAGFDSRAWRLPALAAVPTFEVDRAATAAEKHRRAVGGVARRSAVTGVVVDFDRDRLSDALDKAGFDPRRPTVVIWEGVTNYLNADAVHSVLAWAGSLAAGSKLVFTYIDRRVLDDPASFAGAQKILDRVARAGEPWTFGILPDALPQLLHGHGLVLAEDLSADDYRARYFGAQAHEMGGYAFYRAALATVVGRHA